MTTHYTSILISAPAEKIWQEITNVRIEAFRHPWHLRLLDIPKPLKATVTKEGVGGSRTAEFENGGRFSQEIIRWELHKAYAFRFNADPNFRVAYFFNLAKGPIIIRIGGYELERQGSDVLVRLQTTYEITSVRWLLSWLFPPVLNLFSNYLLRSIKKQCEK